MRICNVLLAGLVLLLASLSASAFTPITGHWWSPNESGSGYNIDIQNGVLVVAVYAYKSNGDSEWYLASGAMSSDQRTFTGTLDKYRNGQCISCSYTGRPNTAGNDGTISINFNSETSARVTLPGGRTTNIVPFNFAYGDPPQALLGEWIFVYDIVAGGTTFAERFEFYTGGQATTNGTGQVIDTKRYATCEYQTAGQFAQHVLCFDFTSFTSSAPDTQNIYLWKFGLGETFDGFWISPTTYNQYPMKGFRVASNNRVTKSRVSGEQPTHEIPGPDLRQTKESAAISGAPAGTLSPERAAALERIVGEMRQNLQRTRWQ